MEEENGLSCENLEDKDLGENPSHKGAKVRKYDTKFKLEVIDYAKSHSVQFDDVVDEGNIDLEPCYDSDASVEI